MSNLSDFLHPDYVRKDAVQTLTNKTLVDPVLTLGAGQGLSGQAIVSQGVGQPPTFASVGGAWEFLASVTASNSATVNVEHAFDSTYDEYVIIGSGIVHQTGAQRLCAVMKIGGTYRTDAYYAYMSTNISASLSGSSNNSMRITNNTTDNSASFPTHFEMRIPLPYSSASVKQVRWFGSSTNANGDFTANINLGSAHYRNSNAALTGVRFFAESGNLTTGTFRLYGIKKS